MDQEQDLLILRYLEGRATGEEQARLEALLEAEPLAREELLQQARLTLALKAARRRGIACRGRRTRLALAQGRVLRPWRVGVALLLLTALAAFGYYNAGRPTGVRLAQVEGPVELQRAGRPLAPRPDLPLDEGTRIEVPEQGTATLLFPDQTRVVLQPGSRAAIRQAPLGLGRLLGGNVKLLSLEAGTLEASVTPQGATGGLAIQTPFAQAQVLGTELRMEVGRAYTQLEVSKGAVKLRGSSETDSVEVQASQQALAAKDQKVLQTPLGSGLRGRYFALNAQGALDRLLLSRIDPQVNFNWDIHAPSPEVPADYFGVRWEGTLLPRFSETYLLQVQSDDGVRLWIDDKPILDQWHEQSYATQAAECPLQAGRGHTIRLEYFEAGGYAQICLSWSSPSQHLETIPKSRLLPAQP